MVESVIQQRPEIARLRPRNQLTLPEPVVRVLGARPGERFLVSVDGPDSLRLVRIRTSYAGALAGMWGSDQDAVDAWLSDERGSWLERQRLYEDDEPGQAG
ncbi:hypothetical protein BH24CHL9_BH24CHL9_04300 [soil metagenome]